MRENGKTFYFQTLYIVFMIGVLLIVRSLYKDQMTYKTMCNKQQEENKQLKDEVDRLQTQVDAINQKLEKAKDTQVLFYIDKLKDPSFTRAYGELYTCILPLRTWE